MCKKFDPETIECLEKLQKICLTSDNFDEFLRRTKDNWTLDMLKSGMCLLDKDYLVNYLVRTTLAMDQIFRDGIKNFYQKKEILANVQVGQLSAQPTELLDTRDTRREIEHINDYAETAITFLKDSLKVLTPYLLLSYVPLAEKDIIINIWRRYLKEQREKTEE
jgi:hypothetical protein